MDVTVGIETATDFLKHLAIIKSEEEEAAEEPLPVNNGGYDRTLFFLQNSNHRITLPSWSLSATLNDVCFFFPAASSVHKLK